MFFVSYEGVIAYNFFVCGNSTQHIKKDKPALTICQTFSEPYGHMKSNQKRIPPSIRWLHSIRLLNISINSV